VIGVVDAVAHDGLTADPVPGRYVLVDQFPYLGESNAIVLKVEPGRDPGVAVREATLAIQASMPDVAVDEATTMDQVLTMAMGPTRRIMQLMTMLGVLALTLGAVGVYGVVSHFVNRRRRDWIIRITLGMPPAGVVRQVVGHGAVLVVIGCALGLLAAVALMRLLGSLLYGVGAADPLSLSVAVVTLLVTGCLAALLPGARASRANPAHVLRDT
jgi:ABC-type antimicrobial peptide transport system permease subunit